MLVIPERNLILIQPPRTGSTSLRAAILRRYPSAVSLYRHMERAGIPDAYAHFKVACVIRHPIVRLHSLWRYMQMQRPEDHSDKDWARRVAEDANRPFSDWLVASREPFTSKPKSNIANPQYYDVLDDTPATRKSLSAWARPDLGSVQLLHLEEVGMLEAVLDITLPHLNAAVPSHPPDLGADALRVIDDYHHWDLQQYTAERTSSPLLMTTFS